jgi:TRAP-type C4-dicarboxylate transport system permease small subunit
MAESTTDFVRPTDPIGRVLFGISRALAVLGGLLCFLTAGMVTVSVTGRYLFSAPVPGDWDLLGIICGTAVFAFLPYCQLTRGNIVVDFFTANMAPRGKAALDSFGTLLYLLIAAMFTWRLYYGGWELYDSSEVLAAFDFYRWWTVPFEFVCMIVLLCVIAYTLSRDIKDVMTGQASG